MMEIAYEKTDRPSCFMKYMKEEPIAVCLQCGQREECKAKTIRDNFKNGNKK